MSAAIRCHASRSAVAAEDGQSGRGVDLRVPRRSVSRCVVRECVGHVDRGADVAHVRSRTPGVMVIRHGLDDGLAVPQA